LEGSTERRRERRRLEREEAERRAQLSPKSPVTPRGFAPLASLRLPLGGSAVLCSLRLKAHPLAAEGVWGTGGATGGSGLCPPAVALCVLASSPARRLASPPGL